MESDGRFFVGNISTDEHNRKRWGGTYYNTDGTTEYRSS